MEAEAQGPVQSGSRPPEQPHGPAGAPSWDFMKSGIVFPFPLMEQRPGLAREEGREALLSLAWQRGALGRLLSTGLALMALSPLHVAVSTSAGAGLCPGWLQPWLPSSALGWELSPQSWGQGGLCPTVQPQLRGHGPACGSDWDRTAACWSLTTQTQHFPLPFLVFWAGASGLYPGAAAG